MVEGWGWNILSMNTYDQGDIPYIREDIHLEAQAENERLQSGIDEVHRRMLSDEHVTGLLALVASLSTVTNKEAAP